MKRFIFQQLNREVSFFNLLENCYFSLEEFKTIATKGNLFLYFFEESYRNDIVRKNILSQLPESILFFPIEAYLKEIAIKEFFVKEEGNQLDVFLWTLSDTRYYQILRTSTGFSIEQCQIGESFIKSLNMANPDLNNVATLNEIINLEPTIQACFNSLDELDDRFQNKSLNRIVGKYEFTYNHVKNFISQISWSNHSTDVCLFIGGWFNLLRNGNVQSWLKMYQSIIINLQLEPDIASIVNIKLEQFNQTDNFVFTTNKIGLLPIFFPIFYANPNKTINKIRRIRTDFINSIIADVENVYVIFDNHHDR